MTFPATTPYSAGSVGRPAAARHLLHRAPTVPGPDGEVCGIERGATERWDYLSFHAYRLQPGNTIRCAADDRERLVLPLEGRARVAAGGRDLGSLGSRASVFEGPPAPVVLVEPGVDVRVDAETASLVAIAAAPGGAIRRTVAIDPRDVAIEERGEGNTARRVHHLLPPATEAGRLIAFEVFTPGGNWSSYPPHKHDTDDPPNESRLEELYYYRFARPEGFALARVYTADGRLDESMAPRDGDVVLVPEGYHPVGVPAGYDCWYLNVMAGPTREWRFTLDPDHAWLMNWAPPSPTDGERG